MVDAASGSGRAAAAPGPGGAAPVLRPGIVHRIDKGREITLATRRGPIFCCSLLLANAGGCCLASRSGQSYINQKQTGKVDPAGIEALHAFVDPPRRTSGLLVIAKDERSHTGEAAHARCHLPPPLPPYPPPARRLSRRALVLPLSAPLNPTAGRCIRL